MSLNGALAVASNSLQLFSLGVQVAGHNINNASTDGYVRDDLRIQSGLPYRTQGVLVGTGALAAGVQQQLDRFLEARIHSANSDTGQTSIRNGVYTQLQDVMQLFNDGDFANSLSTFLTQLQSVVNQPESTALRSAFVQAGSQFATSLNQLNHRVSDLILAQNDTLKSLVTEANDLITTIQRLNPQISQMEANGLGRSDAGSLRIERLNAMNRLSELIPLRMVERPSGEVDLYSGSDYLLIGNQPQQLQLVANGNNGNLPSFQVQFSQTKSTLISGGGEIRGTIEARDQILGGFLSQLDTWTGSLIQQFNQIHSGGEGLVRRTTVTSSALVDNPSNVLNAAGLPFSPVHGSFDVNVVNRSTGLMETTRINVDLDGIGSDMTLNDLRTALAAVGNVNATLDSAGRLTISTDSGYEFSFANDSSGVLASLGINSFFAGSTSGDIRINADLAADPRLLATGQGGGASDNRNAVLLAQLSDKPIAALGNVTLSQGLEQMAANVVQSAAAESALASGSASFLQSLQTQREQRSGVSLDEETLKVLQLQRNYQAAAKIITTVDQLLNVLLNI